MTHVEPAVIPHADWCAEAKRRFGDDPRRWRFVCPSCGHTQSIQDFLDAGLSEETAHGSVYFSCIGRYVGGDDRKTVQYSGGPCTYAGGGLFRINPVLVEHDGNVIQVFDFAPPTT